MSDDLVERVARGLMPLQGYSQNTPATVMYPIAEAIIDLLRPAIREEALEEAAKVARGDEASATEYYRGRVHAAAAIRALVKEPTDPGHASGFGS